MANKEIRFELLYFKLLSIFYLVSFAPSVYCSGLGKCPRYISLKDFDVSQFIGRWYEVERSFYFMELSASCTVLDISLAEKENIYVNVSTVNRWSGRHTISYGLGIPLFENSSIFRFKPNNRLPHALSRMIPGAGMYSIVSTDYERFAIMWSCSSITLAYIDQIWLLGRERDFSAPIRAKIYQIMQELQLDPERLLISKNVNCPM